MNKPTENRSSRLSVQQLRTFCTVFHEKSYAETARQLNVTVPTVWEQIKSLERAYGVTLFVRNGRQIKPTEAAQRLVKMLEPLTVSLDSTFEMVGSKADDTPTSITIAGGTRMLIEDFGDSLAAFRSEFAGTPIRLISAGNRVSQEHVLDGTADVAFMLEPPVELINPRLEYQLSYKIDYLAVFPKRHRLKNKTNIDLKDLIKEPLVIGHSETTARRLLEQALLREGLLEQANFAIETDNSALTIACVHAGLGVGIVGGQDQGPLMKQLAHASLRTHLGQARIVAVVLKGRLLRNTVSRFIELVAEKSKSS